MDSSALCDYALERNHLDVFNEIFNAFVGWPNALLRKIKRMFSMQNNKKKTNKTIHFSNLLFIFSKDTVVLSN